MREELAKREGSRGEFTATFKRYGSKQPYKGPPIRTLLFVDVCDVTGAVVADHVWFTDSKFWKVEFTEGQRVMFRARVKTYVKGYRGRHQDDDLPLPRIDYKLSHPTHLRLFQRVLDTEGLRTGDNQLLLTF